MDIHFKKSKVQADVKPNNYDINFGVQKVKVVGKLQTKTAIPSRQEQTIQADDGYDALSKVVVEPIPKNYGLITYNGGVWSEKTNYTDYLTDGMDIEVVS